MPDSNAYFGAIDTETMGFLHKSLDDFFQTYDPARPTIILLPGGLGSALHQSWSAFNGTPQPISAFRRVIWVDLGLLFGEAHQLPIDDAGFDTQDRIVVAEGDLDFCFVHPYRDAITYFRDHLNINLLVFGWDWRRKVMTSVGYLTQVLQTMMARSLNLTGQNMLHDTYLVGHSMGGMVAKLLLSSQPQLADDLRGMISVGSPFYGYFGQLDRFYNGVKYFNDLYSAATVARITSSWPGMYSLLPIDLPTYQQAHQQLGLANYPVLNSGNGLPVDPYNANSFSRYPNWVRTGEIPRGLMVRHMLAAPLSGSLGGRVYHLRVNQPNTTLVSATWNPGLPPSYTPGVTPSPIDFDMGGGDNTIPHWSAALASTPAENITDFPTGEHAYLMEERPILAKIAELVTGEAITERGVTEVLGERDEVASHDETDRIIQAIKAGEITRSRPYEKGSKQIVKPSVLRRISQEYAI